MYSLVVAWPTGFYLFKEAGAAHLPRAGLPLDAMVAAVRGDTAPLRQWSKQVTGEGVTAEAIRESRREEKKRKKIPTFRIISPEYADRPVNDENRVRNTWNVAADPQWEDHDYVVTSRVEGGGTHVGIVAVVGESGEPGVRVGHLRIVYGPTTPRNAWRIAAFLTSHFPEIPRWFAAKVAKWRPKDDATLKVLLAEHFSKAPQKKGLQQFVSQLNYRRSEYEERTPTDAVLHQQLNAALTRSIREASPVATVPSKISTHFQIPSGYFDAKRSFVSGYTVSQRKVAAGNKGATKLIAECDTAKPVGYVPRLIDEPSTYTPALSVYRHHKYGNCVVAEIYHGRHGLFSIDGPIYRTEKEATAVYIEQFRKSRGMAKGSPGYKVTRTPREPRGHGDQLFAASYLGPGKIRVKWLESRARSRPIPGDMSGRSEIVWDWITKREVDIPLDHPKMPPAQRELFTEMHSASKATGWGQVFAEVVRSSPMAKSGKAVTCYGLSRGIGWQQEWYETASRNAGVRARALRKLGYKVSVGSVGPQVTGVGRVNMTLLTIHDLDHDDRPPPPDRIERL